MRELIVIFTVVLAFLTMLYAGYSLGQLKAEVEYLKSRGVSYTNYTNYSSVITFGNVTTLEVRP